MVLCPVVQSVITASVVPSARSMVPTNLTVIGGGGGGGGGPGGSIGPVGRSAAAGGPEGRVAGRSWLKASRCTSSAAGSIAAPAAPPGDVGCGALAGLDGAGVGSADSPSR